MSLASELIKKTEKERIAILGNLSDKEFLKIKYDWKFWARPEQRIPKGEWVFWLINAGRGFGKTRTGAEWIIEQVRQGYKRIGLIGPTSSAIRDVMIEGDSGILTISRPDFRPLYEPSKRKLTWSNGATAHLYSAEEPDRIRGSQHQKIWIDELATFKYASETWDMSKLSLRLGPNPQICITTTPKP
ncbi:unnamed protein product, partial [marine sediment metagenome]